MLDAHATSAESLRCTDPPFSFFQLIDDLAPSAADRHSARVPLHRLCSLLRKMGVRSMLREGMELNSELQEEREMLRKKCAQAVMMDAVRVTFFSSALASGTDWNDAAKVNDEDLLAYAVIVRVTAPTTVACSYIYEAIVAPPSMVITPNGTDAYKTAVSNYYIHNARLFQTSIGPKTMERRLPIAGSYFAQQNSHTHVCAHAALRMAINSSPFFGGQNKLTNKAINDILSLGWQEISRGLDRQQMQEVIEAIGGTVQFADFEAKPSMEYDQFVYPLMESGCPVILNIHGRSFQDPQGPHPSEEMGHAVAIMGHTLNTDRWEPEARGGYQSYRRQSYLPTVAWTDHLIINDDNYGMFSALPTDTLRNLLIPDKNPALHAAVAIGIVPKGVRLWGLSAEQHAALFFDQRVRKLVGNFNPPPYWLTKLVQGHLVCRTTLQTKKSYLAHLKETLALIGDQMSPALEADVKKLPARCWLTELTLPQLYTANRHKVADVIFNAGAAAKAHASWKSLMAIRLPGYFEFITAKAQHQQFPITGHTPLIAPNDEVRLCDW